MDRDAGKPDDLGPPPSYEDVVISAAASRNGAAPPPYHSTTPTSSPSRSTNTQSVYTIPTAHREQPHIPAYTSPSSTQSNSATARNSNTQHLQRTPYYNRIFGSTTQHERRKRMLVYMSVCVFAIFMVFTIRFLAFT